MHMEKNEPLFFLRKSNVSPVGVLMSKKSQLFVVSLERHIFISSDRQEKDFKAGSVLSIFFSIYTDYNMALGDNHNKHQRKIRG